MQHEIVYENFIKKNLYPRQLKNHNHQKLINFSSNDYLNLAKYPLLIARAQEYTKKYGAGLSSSRLVAGNIDIYTRLEEQLANALGKPATLIMGTGFQTNISVLEALLDPVILGKEPLVFCDRLCHVSMLASTRYITRVKRFRHNDLFQLQELLEKYADSERPKFILAESVYSMDGDEADLRGLIALAKKYHAMLYIDDAHAVGVYGPSGWGAAAAFADEIDIIMGTFSKALGSFGAYIACSQSVKDYLINKCKGLIYSTALPPAVLGAISAALEVIPQLDRERQRLNANATKLRCFFQQEKLDTGKASTHIVPWIIGDHDKTLRASQFLEELGILCTTIRPPSVPPGTSRIRFCLSSAHSDEELERLMQAIHQVNIAIMS